MSFPTHRFAFATSRAQALFSRALDSRKKSLAPEPDGYAPDYDALVRAAAGLPDHGVIETIEYHDDPLDGRYCYAILKDRLPGGHENVIELGWDVVEDLDCVVIFDSCGCEDARYALGEFNEIAGALRWVPLDSAARESSSFTVDADRRRAFTPRFDTCVFADGFLRREMESRVPEDFDLIYDHAAGNGYSYLVAGPGGALFEAFAREGAAAGCLMGEWEPDMPGPSAPMMLPAPPTLYCPTVGGVRYYAVELKERYECDPRNPGSICYPRFSKYSSLKELFDGDPAACEDFAGIPYEKLSFFEVDEGVMIDFYDCCHESDPLVCTDRERDEWKRLHTAVVRPWNPRVNFYRVGTGPVTPTLREYADADAFLADHPAARGCDGALVKVARADALAQLGLYGLGSMNETPDLTDYQAFTYEEEPVCYDEEADAWTPLGSLLVGDYRFD